MNFGCQFDLLLQKCPFEAIQIINLPKDLDKDTTHRYGPNTFKLHRLLHVFFFSFPFENDTIFFLFVLRWLEIIDTGCLYRGLGKFLA